MALKSNGDHFMHFSRCWPHGVATFTHVYTNKELAQNGSRTENRLYSNVCVCVCVNSKRKQILYVQHRSLED